MLEGDGFSCNGSGREYKINSSFTCDLSRAIYLLGCKVYGKKCFDSTFMPIRARFNNYKSASQSGLTKGNRLHKEAPKKYVRSELGGWVRSKAYSLVEGGWIVQKCGNFGRTYFMNGPHAEIL